MKVHSFNSISLNNHSVPLTALLFIMPRNIHLKCEFRHSSIQRIPGKFLLLPMLLSWHWSATESWLYDWAWILQKRSQYVVELNMFPIISAKTYLLQTLTPSMQVIIRTGIIWATTAEWGPSLVKTSQYRLSEWAYSPGYGLMLNITWLIS